MCSTPHRTSSQFTDITDGHLRRASNSFLGLFPPRCDSLPRLHVPLLDVSMEEKPVTSISEDSLKQTKVAQLGPFYEGMPDRIISSFLGHVSYEDIQGLIIVR